MSIVPVSVSTSPPVIFVAFIVPVTFTFSVTATVPPTVKSSVNTMSSETFKSLVFMVVALIVVTLPVVLRIVEIELMSCELASKSVVNFALFKSTVPPERVILAVASESAFNLKLSGTESPASGILNSILLLSALSEISIVLLSSFKLLSV